MSIEHKILSALKWSAIGRAAAQLISWVITLLVIRLLHPTDYGLMAMVAVITAFAGSVAELGLGASIVRSREQPPEILRRIVGLLYVVHFSLALLLVILAPLASAFFDEPRLTPLIRLTALQFVFAGVAAAPQALTMRRLDFKLLAQVELVSTLAGSVTTLLLAWLDQGVWALVIGLVTASAVRALLLLARSEFQWPSFRLTGIGTHLNYGSQLTASQILWSIVGQSDAIIGGRLLSRDGLGAYAVAFNLALLPMTKILGVVNQIAFSAVAHLQDEADRLRKRLLQALRLLIAVSVPLQWGLSSVAPELVRVVLGTKWEAAIVPLQLISLIVPMRMVMALLNTSVAAVGRADIGLHNTIVAAFVWPACFYVGARFGADGLAAAWLLAAPLSLLINFSRTSRVFGIRVDDVRRYAGAPVLAGTLMWLAVWFSRDMFSTLSDPARLIVLVCVGALVYVPVLALGDRGLLADAKQMLSPGRS